MCLIRKAIREKKARKQFLMLNNDRVNELIKIQSTEFDRKRKLTDAMRDAMRKAYKNGVSLKELSEKYDITTLAVRYNVDDDYREEYNKKRSRKYKDNHSGRTIFPDDLAEYKKSLIREKKIKVYGLI
uniref:Uncharacterized protein n=1 Tax=Siphoviridae sp. ctrpg19 TaxID=2826481 RepID=A0A8S5MKE8_9CAUD|nr:MAG TPA: Protein of unknown function (DUF2481) [Siphoviridae sp. ctrpg19]